MGRSRRAIGVLISFAVAACESFGASAPVSSASSDGGPDAGSSTIADSGGTSGDASPPPPLPTVGFCDTSTFCDDFERETNPQGAWRLLENPSKDIVTMTPDRPRQGDHAIRFGIVKGTQTQHASLIKTITRNGKQKATLKFSFRPPKQFGSDGNDHLDLANLLFPDLFGADKPLQMAVLAKNGVVSLYVVHQTNNNLNSAPVPCRTDDWNDITLHVDFAAKKTSFDVNETKNAGEFGLVFDLLPDTFEVWLGPDFGNHDSAFNLDFDAYRLDLE